MYSEWLAYECYEGGGVWVHIYNDVEGEKARYAYLNAQANYEEKKFNKLMGVA